MRKITDTLWSFLFCSLATMSRNLVPIFNNDVAFCLNQTWNVHLCPTQCISCSLIRVLTSLGSQKILQLLRLHEIMPKWGIFNASLLHSEHGHPTFISKLKFSYVINIQRTKFWTFVTFIWIAALVLCGNCTNERLAFKMPSRNVMDNLRWTYNVSRWQATLLHGVREQGEGKRWKSLHHHLLFF